MSARGPTGFYMQVDPAGTLLLRGELDLSTVQDLQDKLDEIMIPGQPVVMDLAQLMFLDRARSNACSGPGMRAVIQSSCTTQRQWYTASLIKPGFSPRHGYLTEQDESQRGGSRHGIEPGHWAHRDRAARRAAGVALRS